MRLTKVELLWSRACPLACAGCAMPSELQHPAAAATPHAGTVAEWQRGVQQMARWGARFVAIYGAEPLMRMVGLPEVVEAIYAAGMKATVISAIPHSPRFAALLDQAPHLDSLTVSWDEFADADRARKTRAGQHALAVYRRLRDRAAVAMVTEANADAVPAMAHQASAAGVHFLFDLYHPSTGRWSKCSDAPGLRPPTVAQVQALCTALLALKQAGGLVHASAEYLTALRDGYTGNPRTFWHCRGSVVGWLTVDADGSILPCDDWQQPFPGGKVWDEINVAQLEAWRHATVLPCVGCAWNTHFDAVRIEKAGGDDLGSYVH